MTRLHATFIGAVAILLWALLAPLTVLAGAAPPFQMAAMTFFFGGALGLGFALARGELSLLRQPWRMWALGVGGLFGYHALYFAALKSAPPAQASLIAYLWPLFIVLFASLLPGERLTLRHVIGAAIGLGGVAVLILGAGGEGFSTAHLFGYTLAFGCALTWSGYSVLSRLMREAPTAAVAGFCLVTAALAALCHVAFERTVVPQSPVEALAIVALGLGPVGLAFYVWDIGMKRGDIKLLGVASYAAPVMSTLILVTLGLAPATWSLGAACLLIVAGAAVASFQRSNI